MLFYTGGAENYDDAIGEIPRKSILIGGAESKHLIQNLFGNSEIDKNKKLARAMVARASFLLIFLIGRCFKF